MAASSAPRTLADQLRSWSDQELGRLLTERPDLATPAPQDSSQLASRAATRPSAIRAIDQLTMIELTVLEALTTLAAPVPLRSIQARVNAEPARVAAAVNRMRELALVWGADDQLRPLSVITEIIGTTVSGIGRGAATLLAAYGPTRIAGLTRDLGLAPTGDRSGDIELVAGHLAQPKQVEALLVGVDAQARAVLEHLERDGVDGTVESADRTVTRQTASTPVEQLLSRGLLVARDSRHVAVPSEVIVALRGGTTTREPVGRPPELATSERASDLVDRTAAGAAFEFVRRTDLLLEHWGTRPPTALRGGGLGVRDLRATAEMMHLDDRGAALHIEIAAAAGLLAVGAAPDQDAAWLPTDAFDVWSAGSVADRWARLALAWLNNPRLTGLIGTRDESNKPVNALVPELERAWLVETRRTALAEVAALPAGHVLASTTGVPSLVDRMKWLRPRRPVLRAEAIDWIAGEASVLGVLALGGVSAHGHQLIESDDPRHHAAATLEPLLPEPVDHVLLQADLTAVAPGPLEQDLARQLATVADIESRGGATVYRFTASSVRRAFDSGWSAGEIHDFISSASRTPVPQPLGYLVDDVARRFGTVRIGTAGSFLRSDDESALAELVHDPKAASLRLRRIAPTVVVSDVPVDVLLPRLRELGTAPVVEAADGTVRLARKDTHRARSPRQSTTVAQTSARLTARVTATVGAIRSGDRAAASRPAQPARTTSPSSTLAVLRESVEGQATVWIGYVDNHGTVVERVVDPRKVDGGWLTAYDHRADDVRTFAVHRITGVHPMARTD